MKTNNEAKELFILKQRLDSVTDKALITAAKKLKLTKNEAKLIIMLFYAENGVSTNELSETGFTEEVNLLVTAQLAEINEDALMLNGRGKIAAKSLTQAQEKILSDTFSAVSAEERFIMNGVLEKIGKLLSKY